MSIQEKFNKFNPLQNEEVFLILVIILVAITAFGFGRSSVSQDTIAPDQASIVTSESFSIQTDNSDISTDIVPPEPASSLSGAYVASKNSNKYHLPWCSGAKRIKEDNKIWFKDKPAAEAAGYTPAGNCKGI